MFHSPLKLIKRFWIHTTKLKKRKSCMFLTIFCRLILKVLIKLLCDIQRFKPLFMLFGILEACRGPKIMKRSLMR
uniref:Uncharacterized protein n=1 Tax=Arundo donax TaxID=35708 RepID=A0A0A8YNR5_ARUDO